MRIHLESKNSENLILFFCGWGMDENPFSVLKSSSDILYVYDYTSPEFPEFDFSKYNTVNLLAFSYGVYASAIAQLPENTEIAKRTAINGTLVPLDDKYGVPLKQFALTEKMDSSTIVKFRERLFGGDKAKEHFEIFENNLPQRSAQSCTDELAGMKQYVPLYAVPKNNFDKVYIAKHDRCVPTGNQLNFWKQISAMNDIEIVECDFGHFVFYNYQTLEELL